MTLNDFVLLSGAVLGVATFFWTVISHIIGIKKGEPKAKADTYESLASSIEKLNNIVSSQTETLNKLNDEVEERDIKLDTITLNLKQVELERDTLIKRIEILEKEFLIREEQAKALLDRLRLVERERDNLLHRV